MALQGSVSNRSWIRGGQRGEVSNDNPLLLDVVAQQFVLVANVEPAAVDSRMRPTVPVDRGEAKLALESILGRSGFD